MTVTEASILLVFLILVALGYKSGKNGKSSDIDPDIYMTESEFFDLIKTEDEVNMNADILYEYRRKTNRLKAAMLTVGYNGTDFDNLLQLIRKGRVDKQRYLNFRMKLNNDGVALQQQLSEEAQRNEEKRLEEAYKRLFKEE